MDKLKIFSWNVNGIRAVIKKGELQKFISNYNPDIICFQETKAEQSQVDIELVDYSKSWNSSRTKKGYSGTAIFSKIKPLSITKDLPAEIVEKYKLIPDNYGQGNDEGRVLVAEFKDFYLVNVYTPNAKDDLSRLAFRQIWDKAITAYCVELEQEKPVIYCGDMNVAHTEDDLANPKANRGKKGFTSEERAGFDNWLKAGFIDTFRQFYSGNGHYTWWSHFANARARNVGWRIDYFLISQNLKDRLISSEIHANQLGSDHCPISIDIKL